MRINQKRSYFTVKVLILSITAGQGHNSCAKTLSEVFTSMGVENHVLDTYAYISKFMCEAFSEGYLLSLKAKYLYAKGYNMLERREASEHSAMRTSNKPIAKKLLKYINEYAPDAIVYTHVLAGLVLDILKENRSIDCKLYGIVTDFTMHPYWDDCLRSEYIVIPNSLLTEKAKAKGFLKSQILDTGIPISEKFSTIGDKSAARQSLGLDEKLPTILLMGGSMGYGNIASVVKQLDEQPIDFQIISVCGNNAEMKKTIDSLTVSKKLLSLGYCKCVDRLMDASDCIITKPGGLTSSEALAKRLPMIIANPIPGQEERNTDFLLNCGAAIRSSEFQPIDEMLHLLFSSKTRLSTILSAVDEIRRPRATRDLCEFIVNNYNKKRR